MPIPIIDLFAGPGGLGEGFMSLKDKKGNSVFDIKLSIEKDENAHRTLTWRSFYRQFTKESKAVPEEYFQAYRAKDLKIRDKIIEKALNKYPEGSIAKEEARLVELGSEQWPPKEVDKLISKRLGRNKKRWVLIGGPPCQAYSLVGRSRRQWKDNLDKTDVRVHLYKEYLRIIAAHSPSVFVMENVKGLLSSKVDGVNVFDLIKRDLSDPSIVFPNAEHKYKVYSFTAVPKDFDGDGRPIYEENANFLIKSEDFGIPQKRHRVILLGIREDIKVQPGILTKTGEPLSLKEVIGDLPKIRSGINRTYIESKIIGGKKKRIYKNEIDSDIKWAELINSFKSKIISWNGFAKNYSSKTISVPKHGIGAEFIKCKTPSIKNPLYYWYDAESCGGIANHESRTHLVQDLKRYMFSSMFTKLNNRFPRLDEFEKHSLELLPDHKNVNSGKFTDRFRVQLPQEPATTVTSHISKDGHYFIHYDPEQCRSLTVREAARIQTFADDYLFCGSRTAQYHQVGNAVPPFLAFQIAEVVISVLKN